MKIRNLSFYVLQFILIVELILPSVLMAVVNVDMTKTVESNSMLLLFILFFVAIFIGGVMKHLYDKMERKMDKVKDENIKVEEQLIDSKINQLQNNTQLVATRLSKIESECHACQKILPVQYVTKAEFDKLVLTQREDVHNITSKLESIIKDLKIEIRSDMKLQIERIIALLERKLQTQRVDKSSE